MQKVVMIMSTLANRDALAAQRSVEVCGLHGEIVIQHRRDLERTKASLKPVCMSRITRALQNLQENEIADEDVARVLD